MSSGHLLALYDAHKCSLNSLQSPTNRMIKSHSINLLCPSVLFSKWLSPTRFTIYTIWLSVRCCSTLIHPFLHVTIIATSQFYVRFERGTKIYNFPPPFPCQFISNLFFFFSMAVPVSFACSTSQACSIQQTCLRFMFFKHLLTITFVSDWRSLHQYFLFSAPWFTGWHHQVSPN